MFCHRKTLVKSDVLAPKIIGNQISIGIIYVADTYYTTNLNITHSLNMQFKQAIGQLEILSGSD